MNRSYQDTHERAYALNTDPLHRKRFGQFFTPYGIAKFMAEWVLTGEEKTDPITILDPAAGLGIFPRAIKAITQKRRVTFDLWELDKSISTRLDSILTEIDLDAHISYEDFLQSEDPWEKKYDAIIANPPYYKHHFIKNKAQIYEIFAKKINRRFSQQTNIYCLFLIKCLELLKEGGKLAFIVPSEFLNANYGEEIKAYLLSLDAELHLIEVNSTSNVFEGVQTTSCIVLIEKKQKLSKQVHFYTIEDVSGVMSVQEFFATSKKISFEKDSLKIDTKWRNYFRSDQTFISSDLLIPLASIGSFSRGIATGANDFFTLSQEEAHEHQIPIECLLPCIVKSNLVKENSFDKRDFNDLLISGKKAFLLDASKDPNSPAIKKYLDIGIKRALNQRYLTKSRNLWFAMESRSISKIWAGVFGRGNLKLIWNESECLSLTCFHTFSPLRGFEDYQEILFVYLSTDLGKVSIDREKRQYGDGLEKMEPSDLNKVQILDPRYIPNREKSLLKKIHSDIISKDKKKNATALKLAHEIFTSLF